MSGIFIRSLNPYGFAAEQANTLGYSMAAFTSQYLRASPIYSGKKQIRLFP